MFVSSCQVTNNHSAGVCGYVELSCSVYLSLDYLSSSAFDEYYVYFSLEHHNLKIFLLLLNSLKCPWEKCVWTILSWFITTTSYFFVVVVWWWLPVGTNFCSRYIWFFLIYCSLLLLLFGLNEIYSTEISSLIIFPFCFNCMSQYTCHLWCPCPVGPLMSGN